MGGRNAKHKLSKEEMDRLMETTKFSKKQIKQWYKGYMKDCPSGMLNLDKFLTVYSQFFPGGNAHDFYKHVFRTFDRDNSGTIDFSEFLSAISITQTGKPEEKLDLAFRLYDIDQSGTIEMNEMTEIMQAIYCMIGDSVELAESPATRTRKIFQKMDSNNDGSLSRDEFIQACLDDQTLYSLLAGGGGAEAEREDNRDSASDDDDDDDSL